jgi:hypothetical protein
MLTLPAGTQQASLLNSQGQVIQRVEAAGNIDVRSLPAGLYNLRTTHNGKISNQHIEVKH